jgi:DNA adenine methylase
MIFISGYENDLYNSILSEQRGWYKGTIDTITKGTNGDSHDRTEVVWMNKHFQRALKTNKIPIELSEKESKQGKLNPIR